jgi:hypothetical protein
MQYSKPELVLIGQAESLVLGVINVRATDPSGLPHSSMPSSLEFED